MKSDVSEIPGIGTTFTKDFARIGVTSLAQLRGKDPEQLYKKLVRVNAAVSHATSKNSLRHPYGGWGCVADPFGVCCTAALYSSIPVVILTKYIMCKVCTKIR